MFLDGFGLPIYLLENNLDEAHLTVSESTHLLNALQELGFRGWDFKTLNESFGVLELLLLQLTLDLLWVVELKGVRYEFKRFVGF